MRSFLRQLVASEAGRITEPASMPASQLRAQVCEKCGKAGEHDSSCGGDVLAIHAKCHTSEGTRVFYLRSRNALRITCRKCKAHVVDILLDGDDAAGAAP